MSKKVDSIDPKIIDELIKTYEKPEDLWGENGILKQLQKSVLERILEGEITTELGYKKHDSKGNNSGNSRNGYSEKTIKCTSGELPVQVPR
ncbi:MAG TPA: hypothetical protein DEG23_05390, partial [Coxiellaceae bacterium]|nr:hypothetical protein [Coxiellaceae bacterium]